MPDAALTFVKIVESSSPTPKKLTPTMKTIPSLLLAISALAVAPVFAQDTKPADPAPAAPASDVTKVKLGVIPAVMKFDKTEFEVKAGGKVVVLFTNEKCPLQHNLLILKPGTKEKVGAEADKLLADPNAMKNNYVPNSPDILVKGNKLIGIGGSDLIEFTAPTEPGDYPFICTFPGHWRLMNGVMKVK